MQYEKDTLPTQSCTTPRRAKPQNRKPVGGANHRGVTLKHHCPCEQPIWLRSPSSDFSVLHRDDRAHHLVHRGAACREPSSCSQFQELSQEKGSRKGRGGKGQTGLAPKVGVATGREALIWTPYVRARKTCASPRSDCKAFCVYMSDALPNMHMRRACSHENVSRGWKMKSRKS